MQNLFSYILSLLASFLAVAIVLTLHEFSHAFVAYKCGDPTPKWNRRLTLNPLAHFDILGLVLFAFAGFGWAKPVPVDSRYFKKLASAHITSSLIGFVSDDPADSYEYKALLPDQYQRGMENLFVFSLIRFFATESWSDQDVRKCHASVIVALRKLVSPNISDDLKAKMRTAISSYLKRFYE